jgi:hypothetical protein
MLAINLVKRPRIPKAAIPHLIDRLDGVSLILALRPAHDRLHRPPPHAVLMLIHKLADLVAEELVGPSALATERARAYLVRKVSALIRRHYYHHLLLLYHPSSIP